MAIDIDQVLLKQYETDGFFKVEGFVDDSVGRAMLDDVVGIVRASDRGERVDALVMPEAQPDFARRAEQPEHIPDQRPGANYGYMEIVGHDMDASTPTLMQPGDLLVFDSHLMHRSTDNVSTGIRAAMVFHVAAAGTVDNTEKHKGYKSPVNDWVPLLRGGAFVQ